MPRKYVGRYHKEIEEALDEMDAEDKADIEEVNDTLSCYPEYRELDKKPDSMKSVYKFLNSQFNQ